MNVIHSLVEKALLIVTSALQRKRQSLTFCDHYSGQEFWRLARQVLTAVVPHARLGHGEFDAMQDIYTDTGLNI